MPFIGNQPAESYSAFQKQDFSTSATTSYTLDHPVANQNEIALFINFVRQEPTAAYTASGTTLTLTSATASSDDMYCVYLGKAVQTVNPPSGSVGAAQLNYPLTTFSSTGIDDNADATAITIDSSEQVGIGTTSPAFKLEVNKGSAGDIARFTDGVNANTVIKTSGSVTTFGPDTNNSLAFQQNNTERMRIDTSGNLKFNSGFGSVGTSYGVRAWVVFDGNNGSITNSGNAEGNVSSVTRHGTGNYTVNFTNAMPDTEYTVTGSTVGNNYGTRETFLTGSGGLKGTSSIPVQVHDRGSSFVDNNRVNVNVVR